MRMGEYLGEEGEAVAVKGFFNAMQTRGNREWFAVGGLTVPMKLLFFERSFKRGG